MDLKPELLSLNDFISGLVAGVMQVSFAQPFDLVKFKVQTGESKQSFRNIIRTTYANEGVYGFYKGGFSPLIGNSICFSLVFGSNQYAKRLLNERKKVNLFNAFDFGLCGAFSGVCSSFLMTPVEMIKIKVQSQRISIMDNLSVNTKFSGSFDCFYQIASTQGIRGLYKGFKVTLLRDVLYYFIAFGHYDSRIQRALDTYQTRKKIPYHYLVSYSAVSGILGWSVIYPLDLIKSHIQKHDKSMKLMDCIRNIFRDRGFFKGFYRGISTVLVRTPWSTSIVFLSFEMTSNFLHQRSSNSLGII